MLLELDAVRLFVLSADLGSLTADQARALVRSGITPVGANTVDEPLRLAVLPEHWTGWTGRPGLKSWPSGTVSCRSGACSSTPSRSVPHRGWCCSATFS